MSLVEFDSNGEVKVRSLQHVYPKLYERILSLTTLRLAIESGATVDDCFVWDSTPEKFYFWEHVNYGRFDQAAQRFPEYFVKVSSDGLSLNDVSF
jgi:hypothetical protein